MFLFPSWCVAYSLEMSSVAFTPEFSASARGSASKASANFLIAYCSRPGQDCHTKTWSCLSPWWENAAITESGMSAYLSVGSELLGQFDLCGTCSRYQPLVLGNKHTQHWKHCSLRQNIVFSMYICYNLSLCWHTLTKSLKVLTPSSTALSMSSIRLSVEPLITTVEMAPSSLSVKGNTPLKLNITTKIRCDNIRKTADYTVFENHHLRVPNFS